MFILRRGMNYLFSGEEYESCCVLFNITVEHRIKPKAKTLEWS
jgi:hypothetical protein